MYQRTQVDIIAQRMREKDNPLIQVVVGPRQTGKSTMIAQALSKQTTPARSIAADETIAPNVEWLQEEWQQARNATTAAGYLLVIDEVQKIEGWPNAVKSLWDADRRAGLPLKIVLGGSSSMLLRHGLEDSLTGRFELIRSPHWSYAECKAAFGFSLDDFLFFGGFPGAARLVADEARWRKHLRDAIIEPTISQDVLELEPVRKPALMRALFQLGAVYSGQELSYTKMLGQLQDAGNTVTLAHYLTLLDKAGMVSALPKFSPKPIQQKKSSPKLMVHDTALMTAMSQKSREIYATDHELKGRLVESAVGAYLLARSGEDGFDVSWWREGNKEVDFVITQGDAITAIEVKSGHTAHQSGMADFLKLYPHARRIVVGGAASGSVRLEDFLMGNAL